MCHESGKQLRADRSAVPTSDINRRAQLHQRELELGRGKSRLLETVEGVRLSDRIDKRDRESSLLEKDFASKKTWDLFFAWSPDKPVFEFQEMNITAGNDVAFVTAMMRCAGRTEKESGLEFRLTVGLRKIDDQWVVTHEHHSIPAE
jgi:hypothetical protein